jgi:hypothetical protein
MIFEYAEMDFSGRKAVVVALGVSGNDISRLTSSANNIAPSEGGRHANGTNTAEWSLERQREFIAAFLKRCIVQRSASACSAQPA